MAIEQLKKGGIHQKRDELKRAGWHLTSDGKFKNVWLNNKIGSHVDLGVVEHKWILFDNDNNEWALLDYTTKTRYGIRTISGLNSLISKKTQKYG